MAATTTCDVFLGGSCNPTTWRRDVAMPMLEKAGISFYNPQVDDWHEGLIKMENDAKDTAGTLLFVIDDMTRGVMSVAEAAYYIGAGRKVVLAIQKYPVDDSNPNEGRDINRGREFLRNVAGMHGINVFADVNSALEHIVEQRACKAAGVAGMIYC